MGLDMWLVKEKDTSSVELCYWHKASAIRGWFHKNIPDFEENGATIIKKEHLVALLDACTVVSTYHDWAARLLPIEEGFFFGSKEYNETYFKHINYTIDMLKQILDTVDFDEYTLWYEEHY